MVFSERRRQKYKESFRKIPYKLRSLKFRGQMLLSLAANLGIRKRTTIAVTMDGGLGDYIIAARALRDLAKELPGFTFHVYAKNETVARWVVSSNPACTHFLHPKGNMKLLSFVYAAKVRLLTFAAFDSLVSENASLRTMHSRVRELGMRIHRITDQYPHLDGYLGRYACIKGLKRHNFVHHMLGIAYGGDELPLVVQEPEVPLERGAAYITISNGFDVNTVRHSGNTKTATKVYPHFQDLVYLLKHKFPHVKIVQIGNSSSLPLQGTDLNLVSKTSLPEAAAILKGSLLHIDNEGGLVHLARTLGTQCCVIFGPTDLEYFGYEANINIPPAECGNCWWMEPTWMSRCIRGFSKPQCLSNRTPVYIAETVASNLEKKLLSTQPQPQY